MAEQQVGPVELYSAGKVTVLGFGGRDVLDDVNLASFRDACRDVIRKHDSEVLAFDMTGVKLIPSGLLGLLASLRDLGVEVQIFNPSHDVQEVLEITKLNQVIHTHEVQPPAVADTEEPAGEDVAE